MPRSGAELYAICSSALLKAISRNILSARKSIISNNTLLTKCVEDEPNLESIILNGIVNDDENYVSYTTPVVSLTDFIIAAKELDMYKE